MHHLPLIPFLLADIITPDLHYLQRDRHSSHRRRSHDRLLCETALRALKPLLGQPAASPR